MDVRKQCELVEVVYRDENQKAILTFLDIENGEVLEINFNKQIYDNGKFVPDAEKAAKVDEWCETYFDTTFDKLSEKIGDKHDVYVYEKFNSLWETKQTNKFNVEDKGKFFQTEISRIEDDGFGIHIYFDYKDNEYESKMMYSDYLEQHKKWFVNPQKRTKQYEKFKDLFGVDIENREEIIGKPIAVEVKVAFSKHAYCEIKKPDWA